MQYHFTIYFDPKLVFGDSPEAKALLDEAGPHGARLAASGHLVSSYPLNLPTTATTVKVRAGTMSATDGPFLETKEVVGGFVVIEARDIEEAKALAAEFPHARLGHIEIRPAIDFSQPRPKL